jgi:SMP-30/Gluconolactonase/LRE-like region
MKPIAIAMIMTAVALVGSPRASAAEPCNAQGKLHFICGTMNVEDLVQVPGTKWVIGSGLTGGGVKAGELHLIDSESKQWKPLFPVGTPQMQLDKATYAACPGAPDLTTFSAHGLNIRANSDGTDTLYVVNHGGRDSIELFTVDPKGAEPRVTWVGCAVMPAHTWPNSVAPLPDGGMVVTNMFDPTDQKASDKMNAGEITGSVYEWHPDTGYKLVPDSEMSGNNGIEVSHDGKWIYVAAWGNKEVVRLSRDGQPPKRTALPAGFLVDNLRWAPDGMLMVAGQDVGADKVFACFQSDSARCTQPWRVLRWDTAAMKLDPVMAEAGNPEFGDATVALEVGGDTFIGTFRGDRIAYFPSKSEATSPAATGSSEPPAK